MNNYQLNTFPANILIVDDTPTNLRLLSQALSEEGYQVRAVINGEMALTAIQTSPPDLILLDVTMPNMDGYEVCQRLKASPETADIPVIFLSALDETLDKVKAFTVGGVDYITKPFELLEVLVRIKNQLNLQAAKAKIHNINLQLEDKVKQRTIELETKIIELEETQKQLRYMAFHDQLTGLPNRTLFLEILQQGMNRKKRQQSYLFAVLFLDCDRFKVVNDSLGHLIGDQILIGVSNRIKSCLRPYDYVARLGGDEFIILLETLEKIDDSISIAKRINQELIKPFQIEDKEIFLSVSIGIVLETKDYEKPEFILRDADIAMYKAKKSGRACYQVFTANMHSQVENMLDLESKLRWALERQEFTVYYQPIVSLNNGIIAGFEALVRWNHPEKGFISPAEFIPMAEETGLILPMDMWVLREACHQLKIWQGQQGKQPSLTMSVNLSAKHFSQPNLIEQIEQIIEETEIQSKYLKLEITETVIMENSPSAAQILEQLRDLQIQLSIDDFGTGYSSLSYLHRFPVNTLKIDRSFISTIDQNLDSKNIIQSVITIAHNLKMDVVAEGIETATQLEHISNLGSEYGQGYFFSKPLEKKLAYSDFVIEQIRQSHPIFRRCTIKE
jgi:diguanylate cyclase (GGDEF)-like protein